MGHRRISCHAMQKSAPEDASQVLHSIARAQVEDIFIPTVNLPMSGRGRCCSERTDVFQLMALGHLEKTDDLSNICLGLFCWPLSAMFCLFRLVLPMMHQQKKEDQERSLSDKTSSGARQDYALHVTWKKGSAASVSVNPWTDCVSTALSMEAAAVRVCNMYVSL